MIRQPAPDLPVPEAEALAQSEALVARLRAEIEQAGGFIGFDRYMAAALYTPGLGYYSGGAQKFGGAGDFVTAPEISPLFSRCLARQVMDVWRQLQTHNVLEFGAGSGRMATDMLLEFEAQGLLPARYYILELSGELRARQRETIAMHAAHLLDRVEWLDALPSVGFEGVVESDLLGDHGLRLDHPLDPVGAGDLAHVVHRLGGVCGEEHGAAEPLDSVRELLEVPIEVGEGVKADPPCPVAHRLERSVVGHRSVAHLGEAAGAGQVGRGAVASEGAGGALHEGDGLAHEGAEPPRISAM